MDRVIPVVGVNFILLTTGFTLIFARLIARDRVAVPPDASVFPRSRTHIHWISEAKEQVCRRSRRGYFGRFCYETPSPPFLIGAVGGSRK